MITIALAPVLGSSDCVRSGTMGRMLQVGREMVALEIAGVRLELIAASSEMKLALPSALEVFRSHRASPPDITLAVEWMEPGLDLPDADARQVFDSQHLWQLLEHAGDYWFRFASPRFGPEPYKLARLAPGLSRGTIYLSRRLAALSTTVDPLEHPLGELLWIHWLPARRGLDVHSCGVIDVDGKGYLFVGVSGAGKTTTARLWEHSGRPITILSDDRIVVREQGGEFRMWGTPWHGEAELASPASARLSKVYLLNQADHCAIAPLPRSMAAARLLACSFLPFHDRAAVAASSDLISDLVHSVECRELSFTRDGRAVQAVVDRLDPDAGQEQTDFLRGE
jgi:hypothetical protein